MSTPTETIRMNLMAHSDEYQRLNDEHARYAAELERLSAKPFLNESDRAEEVRLKKLKLRLKDQMALLEKRSIRAA